MTFYIPHDFCANHFPTSDEKSIFSIKSEIPHTVDFLVNDGVCSAMYLKEAPPRRPAGCNDRCVPGTGDGEPGGGVGPVGSRRIRWEPYTPPLGFGDMRIVNKHKNIMLKLTT